MAHLLLFDLPGGNDFAVVDDAVALGHRLTLFTADAGHYRRLGDPAWQRIHRVVEVRPWTPERLRDAAAAIDLEDPFAGLICLIDIRIVDASMLAHRLGLPFLSPAAARLLRDKAAVRAALQAHGIAQPPFAEIGGAAQLRAAVTDLGLPLIVKPADGYGSQDVTLLRTSDDVDRLCVALAADDGATDYGFGVRASRRLLVERYIEGALVGCDCFVRGPHRVFLGVNAKERFAPPSFAFRGSCFPSRRHDVAMLEHHANRLLDAVGFDFGACHIEMILGPDGPVLVEINPRLVSAQIPFQMGYAFGRSIYAELIDLHRGQPLDGLAALRPQAFSTIRWLVADAEGILEAIDLPAHDAPAVQRVVLLRRPGDAVRPPRHNGDRLGYVIATGSRQDDADAAAEAYLAATRVRVRTPAPIVAAGAGVPPIPSRMQLS